MEMVLAHLGEDRQLRLEVIGSLSLVPAEQLKTQFEQLARRGLAGVVIDLARADVITSVGLSSLAVVWERATDARVPIRFTNVSKDLVRLFEVCGLREIFLPESIRRPGAPTPGAGQ